MKGNLSRRTFVRRATLAILGAPIAAHAVRVTEAFAANTALDPSNPTAMALGYVTDATKVDTAKFPKRAGAEGAKQFCKSCILFTQGGLKADGQEGTWGKCTLFPTGLVNENGWCNSWALKPGA